MHLLLDTDIGDDIDDALALGLAVKSGVRIVGITTVYRDAGKRAEIAAQLLAKAGIRGVPVVAGASEPLRQTDKRGAFNYGAELRAKVAGSGDEAARFIAETCEKYGKELTILSIGAETNLALAVKNHLGSLKKAGRIVIMGGCFSLQHDEWNIACDPAAARTVMESGLPLAYVPWELTSKVCIGLENYEYILKGRFEGLEKELAEMVADWGRRNTYVPLLHDPLALYYCMNESAFETMTIRADVLDEGATKGLTLNYNTYGMDRSAGYPITVVTAVDAEAVAERFMRVVFDKPREVKARERSEDAAAAI